MHTVRNLFQRLQHEEDRLPALLDGKTYLVNMNSANLKDVVSIQDITVLFLCLDTPNEEQISTVIFILKLLLPIFDIGPKFEVLSQHLWAGLCHGNNEVKSLCLQEFKNCSNTEIGNSALVEAKHVIGRIIGLVGEEEMSIALAAAEVLSEFGSYSVDGAKVLLQGELLEKLENVMSKDDSVRYRVYDIIIKIQSKSSEHLSICKSSKLLKRLVSELMGDDVLIRVVCVSTLSDMALYSHSLQYLKTSGVIDKLVSLISDAPSNPLSDLYMPEAVKFFGKMCHQDGPENVITIFPHFMDTIFGLINENDLVKKKIGIETIGFLGKSIEGKCVLAKQGNRTTTAVKEIGSIMQAQGTELRLIAINAMCQLLFIDYSQQNDDLVNQSLQWFRCISREPVDTILSLCRQPFTNIKCGGFHLVKTLSYFNWGLEALVEFPTFVEFILDRSADTNKECKDARYEAVKGITESPGCMQMFGNHNYLKFRAFVKEGPVYQMVNNPEVAMETT